MSDLVERLNERAESYRQGGPSSEHTAVMLEEAASRISQQDAELERAKAEARKCAFIEAAEIANNAAMAARNLDVPTSGAASGALLNLTYALRRKAEETRT